MKRRLFLLTAIILSLSLVLTACGEKPVVETNAKQIALDYINNIFDTNETQATVSREQMGCLPDQDGAFATNGNAGETARWYYIVSVPSLEEEKYTAYVVESTQEVIFLSQSESNITLTDEQQKQAQELLAAEADYGNEHQKTFTLMKEACQEWAIENLGDAHPILLDALRGRMPDQPARETYSADYYVITNDARVYCVTVQWPSLQVLNFDVENAK